ncbi:FARNESYL PYROPHOSPHATE SYNTHETASE [Encephalitozoon cuniculi GB-M1]|uniref:FARNESYL PYROPHOSPHATE SYNTHETASE n=2 Tax=Encephalitozoon cuniculi TaxID=6035 RepID=Q8SQS0_ENCCU|nr:bifunctional (2E,6E)-farnesyl diphosphate synthase/dimethylallyltranstransferase [Encephalitozoon cuniculi GB-M1]AGE94932.1 farnesyl pyrophosphate synthetase [Encephalitozoon cuniculi]KMV65139.1 polyprenyl synthetase domain-containing protein [Encephalitozoon cuniculi EcunIII-L]UYI26390.1 farnesyl pyrophosphate synthetase [Encephalitozoon cuniculi]CAD26091.1 FARNESYL PYROPHOSPHATE SYNTHETASE [Encephalitozoon cuniculi GB-M1]
MIKEIVKSRILQMSSEYSKPEVLFLLDYNLGGGKELRYKAYVHVLKALNGEVSMENLIMGYSVELLQAVLLIVDDIMDNSKIRRGKPCYYLKRGMKTVKDAFFLLGAIRKLLSEKMKKPYSDSVFKTCLGQTHDTIRKTRSEYSLETYVAIAESKTGAYTFYLPAVLGYVAANKAEPACLWDFCNLGALIFQMQDDYLNFLPEKSSKSMNDLEEMKCTWFTSRMSQMDNPAVEKYFLDGAVCSELLTIIRSLFGEYSSTLDKLLKKLLSMVGEDQKEVFRVFISFLDARREI